ncbi:Flagellar biosynthesis protein, FliO [Planococcus massiliensis]|uniref:Flagellar biosynthesis protein, FliO n=1 Tax=Planococcus massiliensis TaxID=1499687 RepID=A0A098ER97_9BACL|nr:MULTISPECIES: flagellar biosynthetic protein FliO [Planococcus]MCJ1909757.1 flagellar biosynthetic protein FliO [Planococcus ruber]CEG24327.1 Flagellar biosynthesis protein, FliO [Planococcus massiliensis]
MNQKKIFYVLMAVFFLSLFAWFTPSAAYAAADTNVTDWLEEDGDAEQPAETVAAEPVEKPSFASIIAKLFFFTALIVVLIYGLIKFLAVRQQKLQPNQAVKLMGGTPLGNNKSLQLVKVGGKIYMIGVGDEVTLIKEFTDEMEVGSIEKDLEKQPALFSNPKFKLSGKLFGKTAEPAEIEMQSDRGFENLFKQSLNKQKEKQQQFAQSFSESDDDKEGNSR